MRQAGAAGPPTDAEIEAYYASEEYRRAMREMRADCIEHERARRLARNPSSAPPAGRAGSSRSRERRDSSGRATGDSSGDDSGPSDEPEQPEPGIAGLVVVRRRTVVVA